MDGLGCDFGSFYIGGLCDIFFGGCIYSFCSSHDVTTIEKPQLLNRRGQESNSAKAIKYAMATKWPYAL
jgi:hypothetical protein